MLRNEIWKQLVDAERLVRYYYSQAQYYDHRDRVLRGIILFVYVAGASMLLGAFPIKENWANWIVGCLGLGLIVATVWDMTMRYGEKAVLLRVVCARCDRLLDQWRELWAETEEEVIEDDTLRLKYRYLRDEQSASTELSVLFGIRENETLHDKAEKDAHDIVEEYH